MSQEMSEADSMRVFVDGLKKSMSCARELARACEDPLWLDTANMLEAMLTNGIQLSKMRSMTRIEQLQAANLKLATC